MVKRVAKTRTEVPTIGALRREPDGAIRGWIKGACGCMTHFEASAESDDTGHHRLVGLSDAKSPRKSGAESGPEDAP